MLYAIRIAVKMLLPFKSCCSIVELLLEDGYSRVEVQSYLERMRSRVRSEGEEDLILDLLDLLVGWCPEHMKL